MTDNRFGAAVLVAFAVICGSATAQDATPVPEERPSQSDVSEDQTSEDGAEDNAAQKDATDADADDPTEAAETAEPGSSEPVPSRFGAKPADEAFGAFQRGLYITAHNLALPRAEEGDAAAQTLLAEIYSRGLGRPKDAVEARKWYEKAAAQNVPEAEFRYGLILLQESESTGNPETREEARRLMEEAAERGNGLAAFNVAQMVLSETPGSTGRIEAFDYFMEAAKQNVPDAQYAIARYYVEGVQPVSEDLETAAFWLLRAARGNFDTAQLELGQMLLSGLGVERNLEAGFGWISRAAYGGSILARAELAKLYWGGIGTEPNSETAAAWYVLTRRAGYRDRTLEDFWSGLSDETQRKAIELANQLL